MTAKQAAAYLQVTVDVLSTYEEAGLPVHRLGSGPKAQRRYYRDEIDGWLKSCWTSRDAGTDDAEIGARCNEPAPGQKAS